MTTLVAEAARVAEAQGGTGKGWTVVSDTSWPGYERIPLLVMQGYTAMVHEALQQLASRRRRAFDMSSSRQASAASLRPSPRTFPRSSRDRRPRFVVAEPARAACLYETAKAGQPVKVAHGAPTVMAMLECYEPSQVAWRVLARTADAFMTVEDEEAVAAMNRLARPLAQDPVIVGGRKRCGRPRRPRPGGHHAGDRREACSTVRRGSSSSTPRARPTRALHRAGRPRPRDASTFSIL